MDRKIFGMFVEPIGGATYNHTQHVFASNVTTRQFIYVHEGRARNCEKHILAGTGSPARSMKESRGKRRRDIYGGKSLIGLAIRRYVLYADARCPMSASAFPKTHTNHWISLCGRARVFTF